MHVLLNVLCGCGVCFGLFMKGKFTRSFSLYREKVIDEKFWILVSPCERKGLCLFARLSYKYSFLFDHFKIGE